MEPQKKVNSIEIMVITSLIEKLLSSSCKLLCLCFLSCFCLNVLAQEDLIRNTQNGILPSPAGSDSSTVAQIIGPSWEAMSILGVSPLSINTTSNADISTFLDYGVLLDLEEGYINDLLTNQYEVLTLEVPVNDSNDFQLQLAKVDITSNDFKITTSSGSTVQIDESTDLFYWGIVKNNPGSLAAVSFFNNEVRCIISDKDGNYVLGAYEDAHVLYLDKDLNKPFNFYCNTTIDFFGDGSMENFNFTTDIDSRKFINDKPIEIIFECDYHMYQSFGSNIDSIKNYVTALFNESAVLYTNENIKIQLSEIIVWDQPDPYVQIQRMDFMLTKLSEERSGENVGKLSVLLTDRDNLSGTGFAYTGGLCTTSWSFATVRIFNTNSVIPVSSYSRDVYTLTHELGHLFGSQHTHDCVWGSNQNEALDNCNPYGTVGGCADGPSPIGGGTMMSYCVYEEPYINFEKGFDEEPGERIVGYVNQAKCVPLDPIPCSLTYNPVVFDNNPWLADVINSKNCHLTEIYQYGLYVYIKTHVGNFLYYDGVYYCEDLVPDNYCHPHYSQEFPELTASSCGCNGNLPPPPICNITCNSNPCEEGGIEELNEMTCVCELVEPTKTGCNDPSAINYEETINCPDNGTCIYETGCMDDQIFTLYPWLYNLVDINNCESTTIKEYSTSSYSFIHINDSNSGKFYYQDGTYYCTDAVNYFCPEQYGLSNIGNCWSCRGEIQDDCDPNREIFNDHPFLDDLINSYNCSGISIREYGQFIIIEDADGQSLYLDSGSFYCDWEDCIDFYLPDGAPCVWNCTGNIRKSENVNSSTEKKNVTQIIEIFPNPNNGRFSLKINHSIENATGTLIQLYDLKGKLLKTFNYSDHFKTIDMVAIFLFAYMNDKVLDVSSQ